MTFMLWTFLLWSHMVARLHVFRR